MGSPRSGLLLADSPESLAAAVVPRPAEEITNSTTERVTPLSAAYLINSTVALPAASRSARAER